MRIKVRQCRECGRDMVIESVYQSGVLPRDRYTKHAAHGLCISCYAHARRHGADTTGPVPARKYAQPLSPGQPCRDCQRPLVPQHIYRSDSDRYQSLGYASLGAHGMCTTCYWRAWKSGTSPDPAPRPGPPDPADPVAPVTAQPAPTPPPAPARPPVRLGSRPADDGPLSPADLARIRDAFGLT